jgi:ubiquinone/menaquinone biosynthesis C-methylase UbiE
MDILWILQKIASLSENKVVLDAGAGKGLLQFAIADQGHQVISVDFSERKFQLPIRLAFPVQRISGDLTAGEYLEHMTSKYSGTPKSIPSLLIPLRRLAQKIKRGLISLMKLPIFLVKRKAQRYSAGSILLYRSNILNMHHLENASVDVLLSLSAIEHMEMDEIEDAVKEFKRVLKPGGAMIITTNAAKDRDWYHEPSMGWCFMEQSLRKIFGVDQIGSSNWEEYDAIHAQLHSSKELQRRLSPSYALSGKNGMPWGIWDPQYVPVGIFLQMPQGETLAS